MAPLSSMLAVGFDNTTEIGKLAVKTGVWPLKEYVDGEVIHTKTPMRRVPVERYLEKQGRFRHLFEPERRGDLLEEIQAGVDAYWQTEGSKRSRFQGN